MKLILLEQLGRTSKFSWQASCALNGATILTLEVGKLVFEQEPIKAENYRVTDDKYKGTKSGNCFQLNMPTRGVQNRGSKYAISIIMGRVLNEKNLIR